MRRTFGVVLATALGVACGDSASTDATGGSDTGGSPAAGGGGSGGEAAGGSPTGGTGGAGDCDADLSSDPDNCGACDRVCETGCVLGLCEPKVLAEDLDLHVDGITTMGRIHLGADDVYFIENGGVSSCPKEGCDGAPSVVVPSIGSSVADFSVLPDRTYVIARNDLWSCTTGCAAATALHPLSDDGLMLLPIDTTLWLVEQGRLETCALPDCPDVELDQFTGDIEDIVYDGAGMWKVGFAGVSQMTQFSSTGGYRIAVDDTHVYWVTRANGRPVVRCPKDSPTCASEEVLSEGRSASGIVLDGDNVYFIEHGDTGVANGSLYRCAKDACEPTLLADGLAVPGALAVDEEFVYLLEKGDYASSEPVGRVTRVPK